MGHPMMMIPLFDSLVIDTFSYYCITVAALLAMAFVQLTGINLRTALCFFLKDFELLIFLLLEYLAEH